jgi:hypothetical protein
MIWKTKQPDWADGEKQQVINNKLRKNYFSKVNDFALSPWIIICIAFSIWHWIFESKIMGRAGLGSARG